jgi:hypothetical protein
MNYFGNIKSAIETKLIKEYNTTNFAKSMKFFKKTVLENKELSQMFFLYDELSKPKGMDMELATDYLNESVDLLKRLIEKNSTKIQELVEWIDGIEVENNYSDVDTLVYLKSAVNLEKVVESKKNIRRILTSTNRQEKITENVNIPLSSMMKIVTNTFNKEYSTISEEEKNELKELLSYSKKDIQNKFVELKEDVTNKLNNKLEESEDLEIKEKISQTISKINESQPELITLYKLKQLSEGL